MAGKQALVPLLAALVNREQTGRGCEIEAAQFEAAAYLIADRLLEQTLAGSAAPVPPLGNASRDFVPHGCYPCRGDDRWIALAIETEDEWRALVGVVGEPLVGDLHLARDERFLTHKRIDRAITTWSSERSVEDAEAQLVAAGIHASRVAIGPDLENDHDAHDSGFFAALPHPTAQSRHYTALPVLVSTREGATSRPTPRRAPLLGEHTEDVVYGILAMDPRDVSALVARGVIGT